MVSADHFNVYNMRRMVGKGDKSDGDACLFVDHEVPVSVPVSRTVVIDSSFGRELGRSIVLTSGGHLVVVKVPTRCTRAQAGMEAP